MKKQYNQTIIVFALISLIRFSEPPSPPRHIMAEGISPWLIIVTFLPPIMWNSLSDITYNLTYQSVESGTLSFIQFEATVGHNMSGMEERLIEGLEEDTTYIIDVSAVNGFGSSLPSVTVEASTKAFTSEPAIYSCIECQLLQICLPVDDVGALLLSDAMDLYYYQVNEVTIIQDNPVAPTERFLYRFPAAVQGLHICVCVCVLVGTP